MEVGVRVEIEDITSGEVTHSNSAYLTFVSVDIVTKKNIKVTEVIPETKDEKRRYEQAMKRRQQRLSETHGIIQI